MKKIFLLFALVSGLVCSAQASLSDISNGITAGAKLTVVSVASAARVPLFCIGIKALGDLAGKYSYTGIVTDRNAGILIAAVAANKALGYASEHLRKNLTDSGHKDLGEASSWLGVAAGWALVLKADLGS